MVQSWVLSRALVNGNLIFGQIVLHRVVGVCVMTSELFAVDLSFGQGVGASQKGVSLLVISWRYSQLDFLTQF